MPLARRSSAPLALLLAVIVGSVGAMGVIRAANARTDNIERIDGLELVLEAQDGPAVNYLLVGSDSRENADPNSADFESRLDVVVGGLVNLNGRGGANKDRSTTHGVIN